MPSEKSPHQKILPNANAETLRNIIKFIDTFRWWPIGRVHCSWWLVSSELEITERLE